MDPEPQVADLCPRTTVFFCLFFFSKKNLHNNKQKTSGDAFTIDQQMINGTLLLLDDFLFFNFC